MDERFSRTELLLGSEGVSRLASSRVAVFGIGGVGGYVVEALARSGVGELHLIDRDRVSVSNINRQIIALSSTVYTAENADSFDLSGYDYVVDAVDTVSAKLELITRAKQAGVPVISSMGAGNKLDPSAFEITDIYKTSVCPLARVMRRELKARGIKSLTVVYSKEEPKKLPTRTFDQESGKPIPASYACVPPAVGLIIASRVIRELSGNN